MKVVLRRTRHGIVHIMPLSSRDHRNHFSISSWENPGMDEQPPNLSEETALQALRRRYGYLAAWIVRLNRFPEPSRLPEPTRNESEPRINTPSRQPHPPRPE